MITERAMVSGCVTRDHKHIAVLEAINEIVIRGENNKPIEIDVSIANATIENVFGDGLLIATPTGSTAYNLSAGGPLVDPECRNLIITPIAPIDLNFRPILVPDHKSICLELEGHDMARKFVFADRQELALEAGHYEIVVQRAKQHLKVIEFPGVKGDFFQILHNRTLGQRKS